MQARILHTITTASGGDKKNTTELQVIHSRTPTIHYEKCDQQVRIESYVSASPLCFFQIRNNESLFRV